MAAKPEFRYFLYEKRHPIDENDPAWNTALRLHREDHLDPGRDPGSATRPVTHGEYFSSIAKFLKKNGFHDLCQALSQCLERRTVPEELDQIRICLEKHGRFYHPSRVVVRLSGREVFFVLNLAVTDVGRRWMKNEYQTLKKLNHRFSYDFLPRVYHRGEVGAGSKHPRTTMFLGEWFQDFHEFHMAWDRKARTHRPAIWDPGKGKVFLSSRQAFDLFRQATRILTLYYQFETYEQIYPWHHAAGDFIVKPLGSQSVDVKLITVRQYAALTESQDHDPVAVLNELLLFFLNLSIWMRLDREDGVGDIVWAHDSVVEATVQGFFEGLKETKPLGSMDESISAVFLNYISNWQKEELLDVCRSLTDRYHPQTPEIPVIQNHLDGHAKALIQAFESTPFHND